MGCIWVQGGETAKAIARVQAGFVSAITVVSGGSGYVSTPPVTLSGGGGNGATAHAILDGDKVSSIIVLTAGSGYISPPDVAVEAPPQVLSVQVAPVYKVTVTGEPGSNASVEWADAPSGPWTPWHNVVVGTNGTAEIDNLPGASNRFYRVVPLTLPSGKFGFVWVAPGLLWMGSPIDEPGRVNNEVQHLVFLTQGFWLSDHEVTQGEYLSVTGTNPSGFQGDANLPVESVSWNDAVSFCQKLTERERAAGRISANQAYRLPTEAEWEYAARAGLKGATYGNLDNIAWWSDNSGHKSQPVKQKLPNPLGLYDMLGNVQEWCSDLFYDYITNSSGYSVNPSGAIAGDSFGHVCRGGSFGELKVASRFGQRNAGLFNKADVINGFRLALSDE